LFLILRATNILFFYFVIFSRHDYKVVIAILQEGYVLSFLKYHTPFLTLSAMKKIPPMHTPSFADYMHLQAKFNFPGNKKHRKRIYLFAKVEFCE